VVDSLLSSSTSQDVRLFAFAAVGLVGGVFAKRRPFFCAGSELIAGIGLLAGRHPVLGALMLAGALLALVSTRTAEPAETAPARGARADVASGLTALGVVGLALVGAALLLIAVVLLAIGSLGGSTAGAGAVVLTLALIAGAVALGLLVRRARR
jgi:hypothetical protein